jgi:hypothetical protein
MSTRLSVDRFVYLCIVWEMCAPWTHVFKAITKRAIQTGTKSLVVDSCNAYTSYRTVCARSTCTLYIQLHTHLQISNTLVSSWLCNVSVLIVYCTCKMSMLCVPAPMVCAHNCKSTKCVLSVYKTALTSLCAHTCAHMPLCVWMCVPPVYSLSIVCTLSCLSTSSLSPLAFCEDRPQKWHTDSHMSV